MKNDEEILPSKIDDMLSFVKVVERPAVREVLEGKVAFSDIPLSHPYWKYRDALNKRMS